MVGEPPPGCGMIEVPTPVRSENGTPGAVLGGEGIAHGAAGCGHPHGGAVAGLAERVLQRDRQSRHIGRFGRPVDERPAGHAVDRGFEEVPSVTRLDREDDGRALPSPGRHERHPLPGTIHGRFAVGPRRQLVADEAAAFEEVVRRHAGHPA